MNGNATDRIGTLDIVRGVAVMGILTMNIVGMSMVDTAYMNPRAYGGATGIDLVAYLFNFVLFDGKMRGLFSFLFGASMLLVIDRATAKGESPARIHFARMFWLFVFGLAHLYLIWWGDILHHYAIMGSIAYLMRNLSVRRMIAIGIGLIVVEMLVTGSLPAFIFAAQQPGAPAEMAKALAGFEKGFGVPPADYIAADLANYRGTYADILAKRIAKHVGTPINTVLFVGWETLAYMLFGMAALRSGMLTGAWPLARYRKWLAIGFGIGIPAYAAIAAMMVAANFSILSVTLGVMALATPVRPLMIVGWAALIILATRNGGAWVERIAATGRMAFTNYLMTSILMTTLFYGYGFGLYGELSRATLYLPMLGMWALMLAWSKPWLDRFQYGPLEWMWRSLTRLQLQPMQRPSPA